MFSYKVPAVLFDLFPNLPELFHDFFLAAFRPGRVGKIMMELLGFGREIRTVFTGIVADGDHKVEVAARVFIHMIRGMTGDIHAIFLHRLNGPGVDPVLSNSGTVTFRAFSAELTQV